MHYSTRLLATIVPMPSLIHVDLVIVSLTTSPSMAGPVVMDAHSQQNGIIDGYRYYSSSLKSNFFNGHRSNGSNSTAVCCDGASEHYSQVPIAVVGMACRLPGHCNTPKDLWDFMVRYWILQ